MKSVAEQRSQSNWTKKMLLSQFTIMEQTRKIPKKVDCSSWFQLSTSRMKKKESWLKRNRSSGLTKTWFISNAKIWVQSLLTLRWLRKIRVTWVGFHHSRIERDSQPISISSRSTVLLYANSWGTIRSSRLSSKIISPKLWSSTFQACSRT